MKPLRLLGLLMTLSPIPLIGQVLYVGAYTSSGHGRGIYRAQLDPASGALTAPVLAATTDDPSFLALHPNGRVLYAVNESPTGRVSAFAITPETGTLASLNSQRVADANSGPCHLAVDASGRMLAVANYEGGSVAAFFLLADGRIGERGAFIPHAGPTGPRADRQEAPHAHEVVFSPDQRRIYAPDLGLDRVFIYDVDAPRAKLMAATPAFAAAAPGAGPRHGVFSRDGKFFYVANEIDNTVAAFACDPRTGALAPVQTLSALPPDFHGGNSIAEIQIHPDDRVVYVSNRGADTLAVFARDPSTGRLMVLETVPCGGGEPRGFSLSPNGAWLVCAHQGSQTLAVFAVDAATGRLTRRGPLVPAPTPVCVLFAPVAIGD